MAIIISKNGEDAQKINRTKLKNEDYLQNYIDKNPEAIPVYEIKEDKKLFVAKREFSAKHGPLDALAVDGDGDLYVIETKLQRNSTRRDVVAQALDYGAALSNSMDSFDIFVQELNDETNKNFDMSFRDKIGDFFDKNDEEIEIFLQKLENNLSSGILKFVVVMDAIGERLKDVITYINQNSQFDIYAVQLEYYKHQDFEIIIPKIFGVEVKKNIKKMNNYSKGKWDEESFLNDAQGKLDANDYTKLEKLYNYFKNMNNISVGFGAGRDTASCNVRCDNLHESQSIFNIYADGNIEVKHNRIREWTDNAECMKNLEKIMFFIEKGTTKISLKNLDEIAEKSIKSFTECCVGLDKK